jgi:hypothetical protein
MISNSGEELRSESQKIDKAVWRSLVRQALGSEMLEVIDWHRQHLRGGGGSIPSAHRFSETARDQGESVPWSLVLEATQKCLTRRIHQARNTGGASPWLTRQGSWMTCQVTS